MRSTILTWTTGTALLVMAMPAQMIAQKEKPEHARYVVTDLGTLRGGTFSEAFVVNSNGLVSGTASRRAGTWGALLWYRGLKIDIGAPGLGGQNNQAFGVNERAQAVGQAETSDPNGEDFCGFNALGLPTPGATCLGFLWHNGVMTALPTLGGANGSANMINNRGEVAGYAETNTPDPDPACTVSQFKPVLWKNGNAQELSTVSGDPDGVAASINDKGQAVGASGACGAFNPNSGLHLVENHALLWEKDGSMTDLGNLGGTGGIAGNHACAINSRGQVVGHSELTGNTSFHGFLWTREAGKMLDLGTLDGDYASLALGINDSGEVVGASLDANFNLRAVLWENGVISDLNTLVVGNPRLSLQEAISINSRGEITGVAQTSSGEVHAFLATPRKRDR
jgi:probable HAF family extracellular repeat protein